MSDSRSASPPVGLSLWMGSPAAAIVFSYLVWVPGLIRFSYMWALNPQYYYGWAVPFLSAYLLYDRWHERPVAEAPRHEGLWTGIILLLALMQLPVRFVGEANSSARLLSLAMAVSALGVSIGLVYLAGGRSWLKFFLPPILFLVMAVPWPDQIESPLVQGLMRVNAHISADVVSLAGVPAEARGNVIAIPTGILGVNEACSGIRSLQSTVMAATFLAILYRVSIPGFLGLLIAGSGIAFVCNVIRTTFLTWQGAFHGIEATEKWHDSAGFAILGVVLVCLWFMSQFIERRQRRAEAKKKQELPN